MAVVDIPAAPGHTDLVAWERGHVLLEEGIVERTVVEGLSSWPQYLANWDLSSVQQSGVFGKDMLRSELVYDLVVGEEGTAKASGVASFASELAPPLVYASLPYFDSDSGQYRCAG